ncbi:ABC transporter ATP-binding protein [Castellaniella sp. UC4442_H9]|jgi:branched-chain amino acid transport system ATP-binding protein
MSAEGSEASGEALLKVSDLFSGYGSGDVLQGVSFEVAEGDSIGILGRNGVGKSTLMRTIVGLIKSTRGDVRFRGQPITNLPPEDRAVSGFGYVPQGRMVFPYMSVEDNLRVGALERGNKPHAIEEMFSQFPRLRERRKQRAGSLSGGEQEMLAIARALVGEPRILLLDEPSEGVQPNIVDEIGELIVDLNRKGMTILLVEQNVELMRVGARRGYVMEKGCIVAALSETDIADDGKLRDALAL